MVAPVNHAASQALYREINTRFNGSDYRFTDYMMDRLHVEDYIFFLHADNYAQLAKIEFMEFLKRGNTDPDAICQKASRLVLKAAAYTYRLLEHAERHQKRPGADDMEDLLMQDPLHSADTHAIQCARDITQNVLHIVRQPSFAIPTQKPSRKKKRK